MLASDSITLNLMADENMKSEKFIERMEITREMLKNDHLLFVELVDKSFFYHTMISQI